MVVPIVVGLFALGILTLAAMRHWWPRPPHYPSSLWPRRTICRTCHRLADTMPEVGKRTGKIHISCYRCSCFPGLVKPTKWSRLYYADWWFNNKRDYLR